MIDVTFVQLQHPVGQGGFHSGWLINSTSPIAFDPVRGVPLLVWMYDCGSDQLSVLKKELGCVRNAPVDVLFLSHLDSDHVVGVDTLLTTVARVDEVVLPYLGDDDWALHLAAGASAGSLSGTFIDLVADAPAWFGRRGVRRLTFIEGSEDDDEDVPGPDPVEPGGSDPERPRGEEVKRGPPERVKIGWTRQGRVLDAGDTSGDRAETTVLPQGAVAAIHGVGTTLNWVLSPFAYRPSRAKLARFKEMLVAQFGAGLNAAAYAAQARTGPGRAKLRKCYDAVWATHNLHSMALYAGPTQASLDKLRNTARYGKFLHRVIQPGWVSTGDFDLSVNKRREHLLGFYARYAHLVGQFALPHHGSEHSFDQAILTAFPDLLFALAAVGANGHGHPSLSVQNAVSASPTVSFVRVDENPSSWFQVSGPVG